MVIKCKMGTTEVVIPDGVTEIDNSAFMCCGSLEDIEIPKRVTKINVDTFCGCMSLENVTIPDGVTYIGGSAFELCYSLAGVVIPKGVKEIDGHAVRDCKSLSEIRFARTRAQWETVKKGDDWNDGVPARVVHCADGGDAGKKRRPVFA